LPLYDLWRWLRDIKWTDFIETKQTFAHDLYSTTVQYKAARNFEAINAHTERTQFKSDPKFFNLLILNQKELLFDFNNKKYRKTFSVIVICWWSTLHLNGKLLYQSVFSKKHRQNMFFATMTVLAEGLGQRQI
jgi:hypothetical protein